VERAEPEVTAASAFEFYSFTDDLDDASFPPHPVDGVLADQRFVRCEIGAESGVPWRMRRQ
jgi:hypothetical protein